MLGKIFGDPKGLQDPIAAVIQQQASAKQQTAFTNYQSAQKNAEAAYKKLAALTPDDVNVQYQLGQSAQSAGDYKTAIAAYQRFLKLSPSDVDRSAGSSSCSPGQGAGRSRRFRRRVWLDSRPRPNRPGGDMNFDIKTEQLSDDSYVSRWRARSICTPRRSSSSSCSR